MRPLALLILLCAFALPAQAQGQRQQRPEAQPGERVIERLDRSVDLTDVQRNQMEALLRQHADDRQTERERIRTERQALQDQLLSVLTPQQRAALEAEQTERHTERVDRRVRQMTRALDLTGEQQTRVRALLEAQPMRHDRDGKSARADGAGTHPTRPDPDARPARARRRDEAARAPRRPDAGRKRRSTRKPSLGRSCHDRPGAPACFGAISLVLPPATRPTPPPRRSAH